MKNISSHVSDVLRLYSAIVLFVLEGHGQTKVIAYWPVCEAQLTAPLGAELTDRSRPFSFMGDGNFIRFFPYYSSNVSKMKHITFNQSIIILVRL